MKDVFGCEAGTLRLAHLLARMPRDDEVKKSYYLNGVGVANMCKLFHDILVSKERRKLVKVHFCCRVRLFFPFFLIFNHHGPPPVLQRNIS